MSQFAMNETEAKAAAAEILARNPTPPAPPQTVNLGADVLADPAVAGAAEALAHATGAGTPPPVLEGGLHVRAMADMLLELVPHLPMRPRGPMGTFFYLSGLNTPAVVERIRTQEMGAAADLDVMLSGDGPAFVPTHAQTSWCIADGELGDVARQGAVALDVLKLLIRERAAAAIAGLKAYSPGITDLHWVGPSRQPV